MDTEPIHVYKYTAVMVEPREHKAYKYVLNNFLENLSDEWGFVLFHGNKNKDFVKKIISELTPEYSKRILQLVHINVGNLNLNTYSDVLKDSNFYQYIPSEMFLIFQTDSIILPKNKLLINDFLQYDYVGAPWVSNNKVGNGGLSLRRKSKMLEIIQNKGYIPGHEDVYFALNHIGKCNIPDYTIAKYFSIETMYNDTAFGIHKCWGHLTKPQLDYLILHNSEIQELIDLQN